VTTSPEAIVDCLFICRELSGTSGGAAELEIVNLGYLACLLAVYDGVPPSEWGYLFSATKSISPFSYSLVDAIQDLEHSGLIQNSPEGYRVTDFGSAELTRLQRLRRFQNRIKYVSAACQSTTAIPLPLVTSSLAAEPQLFRAHELSSLRPLLDDSGRRALLTHFSALAQAVPHSGDLFVPAVVWLTFLSRQIDSMAVNEGGGGQDS
jgi:hypothetical protein